MIGIQASSNFSGVESALNALIMVLSDLGLELETGYASAIAPQMARHFAEFHKLLPTASEKTQFNKARLGTQIGEKTGALKEAFRVGGSGNIFEVEKDSLEWGIDETKTISNGEQHVPFFAEWLGERDVELVELTPDTFEDFMQHFDRMLSIRLDRAFASGK